MSILNEQLKTANVSVHVVATGAGAGIVQNLWSTPGSSAYLSGSSFPYHSEETKEFLGFTPKSSASKETAIDLASVAYMKAFRFGDKSPVGVGLTASVASEREHRGDHRCHICVITNDRILSANHILFKGVGEEARLADGRFCDEAALSLLHDALFGPVMVDVDAAYAKVALDRFMEHPFFAVDGTRYADLPGKRYAIMAGAYNPPHEGHFGMQEAFKDVSSRQVVYEVTANPPNKAAITVQGLLQRATMLKGHDRLFTWSKPMFLDKARVYPKTPLIMGADAFLRVLDPTWGLDIDKALAEFYNLGTHFYVQGRLVNGEFLTLDKILDRSKHLSEASGMGLKETAHHLDGRHDVSSTEIRGKLIH